MSDAQPKNTQRESDNKPAAIVGSASGAVSEKRKRASYFHGKFHIALGCSLMLGMIAGEGIGWKEATEIFCSTMHALRPDLFQTSIDLISQNALETHFYKITEPASLRQ